MRLTVTSLTVAAKIVVPARDREPLHEACRSGRRSRHHPRMDDDADLAAALEARDELLLACRGELLRVGTREAAALVNHINALLDLDPDTPPPRRP